MKRQAQGRRKRRPVRRRRSRLGRILNLGRSRKTRASRYQVAVPALQREVTRSQVPPWLISTLLLVVAGWLIYWFSSADTFYVSSLRVEGSRRLPEIELLEVSGLEGLHVFWVNTRTVEQAIEALPEVKSARLRCRLPAGCVVHLVERKATLVWRQGDAEMWIAADGTVMQARGDLPYASVLNGVGSTALIPGDEFDPGLVMAIAELEQLKPEVRVYEYSDQYGLSFRNDYGWLVRLGDGQEMETKLTLLSALMEYLPSQGIAPSFVDVRYPEAPYYGE